MKDQKVAMAVKNYLYKLETVDWSLVGRKQCQKMSSIFSENQH